VLLVGADLWAFGLGGVVLADGCNSLVVSMQSGLCKLTTTDYESGVRFGSGKGEVQDIAAD